MCKRLGHVQARRSKYPVLLLLKSQSVDVDTVRKKKTHLCSFHSQAASLSPSTASDSRRLHHVCQEMDGGPNPRQSGRR